MTKVIRPSGIGYESLWKHPTALKEGDKILFQKFTPSNQRDVQRGYVYEVIYHGNSQGQPFHITTSLYGNVYFYKVKGDKDDSFGWTCNIFKGDYIELNKQLIREETLKEIGI